MLFVSSQWNRDLKYAIFVLISNILFKRYYSNALESHAMRKRWIEIKIGERSSLRSVRPKIEKELVIPLRKSQSFITENVHIYRKWWSYLYFLTVRIAVEKEIWSWTTFKTKDTKGSSGLSRQKFRWYHPPGWMIFIFETSSTYKISTSSTNRYDRKIYILLRINHIVFTFVRIKIRKLIYLS